MNHTVKQFSVGKAKPSSRRERVAEDVRRILSKAFREGVLLMDGPSESNVTIGHVEVTPDLRQAKVWVAPLGGAATKAFEDKMNACAARCNIIVSKSMSMKFSPKISFKADVSFEQASTLNGLIAGSIVDHSEL